MKALKIIGCCMAVLCSTVATAGTQKAKKVMEDGWEKLGMKTVDLRADHDVINVTFHEGFYTRVKFVIRKAPIFLKNINIVFGNGSNKNITFSKHFKAGSTTRIIDLPGNKRIIKKIKLNYKSVPNGNGKAVIIAWGKH